MSWVDVVRKILETTPLLGGDDDAPLNHPIKDLEDRTDFLKGFSLKGVRAFNINGSTGALAPTFTMGEWAALAGSNNELQPVEQGDVLVAWLEGDIKNAASGAPTLGFHYAGIFPSSNWFVKANGFRGSTSAADAFRAQGLGVCHVVDAGESIAYVNAGDGFSALKLIVLKLDGSNVVV